ncbi:putative enzymatic polyprotein, partial [Gregarina niphandrodes]
MDKVFHRLLNAGYTINLQKCQFLPPTLLYLGHIIEDGIIRPNPKKVEAIQLLKSPPTSHEVRSLLGVAGFLQAFIPNYSQVTAPITDLLKGVPNKKTRAVKINWTTKCDDALTELKRLVIDSALVQPLDGDEFLLEVDACSYAIGGVLKLKRGGAWLPVHYVSRKLNATEQNWPIREKEAFAIIYCLQKLDYYVKSRHIVVVTDHQSLKWLMDAKSGKLARWAILLSEYDLDIQFRKGSENY